MGLDAVQRLIKAYRGVLPQVQVANYNCPGQIVISGETESGRAGQQTNVKEAGARRAVLLKRKRTISLRAFLQGAGEKLERAVLKGLTIEINEPQIPYVANVDASYITRAGRHQAIVL